MSNYTYHYIRFAQAYGNGAYSSCTYNCAAGQGTSTSSNSGSLANTGVAVAGLVTLACLIALVAVLVRVWRRPSKPVAQEAVTEATAADDTRTDDPSHE